MVVKANTNTVFFRKGANDNEKPKDQDIKKISQDTNPEGSKQKSVDKVNFWLLTEEQIRKVISYFIKNKNILNASEFAYKAAITYESKAREGIPGAEESKRRFLVLAKTLFRRYNNLEGARWAEQKLLGFGSAEIKMEMELSKREDMLRIMWKHGEINSRKEVEEFLRAFRKEGHLANR